ncbi:60S ribosomal protein L5 [Schizosaccharomyces cryophilus OY26]|uniref:60S ribosomal protein L5 n=1 Tax=Schizosaccharomyces cryophilus (strain OY26 / ATCC MYA-4695 / CBS 11777 / NBRC 106824 / NRRL Y48691) TaxID=653667 RepID=S9VWX4_SCHCR|nr:60S ribosomal protein L5 [Schizosaccharomyces cryophilus OY26]EPY50445.1 60S ribosomal protein L5 [Schizosaccharomyces cryophilus OY26]
MAFVKQVKSSPYFSRFQTKYRRRREGKTDYYARKRMISQAKNKYNAPKYRLVVRFSNRFVTCQVISSRVNGDYVLAAAHSSELPRYGIKWGLANWSAAYATGLLVARRALIKIGLADKYEGITEPEGQFELTEAMEDGPRPFKVFLDVGLKRTSTGSRVFGAMKGASDGGLYVPHSPNRFPGFDVETKELDDETVRKYIYGGHVAEYMEMLIDDDEERFQKQFSSLIADGIESDQLEDIYAEAFAKIREDPSAQKSNKDVSAMKAESLKYKQRKLSGAERKERFNAKVAAAGRV